MNLYTVECKECGYKTQKSEGDVSRRGEDCPICGARNALKIPGQVDERLNEEYLVNHIAEGMRTFGIEGLIEKIEDTDITPLEVRGFFINIMKKHWPLLYPLIKKVNEKDIK